MYNQLVPSGDDTQKGWLFGPNWHLSSKPKLIRVIKHEIKKLSFRQFIIKSQDVSFSFQLNSIRTNFRIYVFILLLVALDINKSSIFFNKLLAQKIIDKILIKISKEDTTGTAASSSLWSEGIASNLIKYTTNGLFAMHYCCCWKIQFYESFVQKKFFSNTEFVEEKLCFVYKLMLRTVFTMEITIMCDKNIIFMDNFVQQIYEANHKLYVFQRISIWSSCINSHL